MSKAKPEIKRKLIGKLLWLVILVYLVALSYIVFTFYDPLRWISEFTLTAGLLAIGFVAIGFILPRGVGRKESIRRAEAAKLSEKAKWGFHSRDREGPWLNYFEGPLIVGTDIDPETTFFSDWVIIENGYVIVNPGRGSIDPKTGEVTYDLDHPRTYAWDGCTPKAWFYWFMLLGTPDWYNKNLDIVTVWYDAEKKVHYPCQRTVFWPLAHKASVVHDALYQFLDTLPITKRQVDKLFQTLLIEAGMLRPIAYLYYLAVKFFGARGEKQIRLGQNSPFRSTTYSDLLKNGIHPCVRKS